MAWAVDRVFLEALALETPAWRSALRAATLVRATDVAASLFSKHPPDGRMDIVPTLQPCARTLFVTCAAPRLFFVRPGEWQPFPHGAGFKWGILCESLSLADAGQAERLAWLSCCASSAEIDALIAWARREPEARWLRRVRLYIAHNEDAPLPAWQAAFAVSPTGALLAEPGLSVTLLGGCGEEYQRVAPPLRMALERGLRALARVGLWVEAMLLCRNIELCRHGEAYELREHNGPPLIGAGAFTHDRDGALVWAGDAARATDPWQAMLAHVLG